MNPYEVLGVSPGATDQEIKSAYRKLMKEFHPDKNKSDDAKTRVVLINAAYEALSHPRKRIQYNEPYTEVEVAEDSVEAYKREFKQKRREEEKRKKERKKKHEMIAYRIMRTISFPILAFAFLLVLDNFLPRETYNEVAIEGWQERLGGRRNGGLLSYAHTQHFTFAVPPDMKLSYPFYDEKKPGLKILATPIFKVPRSFSYTLNGVYNHINIDGTIHSIPIPLPWLLMISSLIVASNKKHAQLLYPFCVLSVIILAYILAFFFF